MIEHPEWWPLNSDKGCLQKWSQTSVNLWDGTSSSCHRNQSVPYTGMDVHNTPEVIRDREKMLGGEWPGFGRGCEHCRDQEAHGGMSDRLQWFNNEANARYIPTELFEDPNALHIKPTQISMHFSNKCNLKCVYCGPSFSSSWVNELRMYDPGGLNGMDPAKNDREYERRLEEEFYPWMEENYQSLKAFDILGGEPWILEDTWKCIDWMIQHPNPECDFEIYSNFQVKPLVFQRNCQQLVDLSKTVKEVLVVASLDCWGPAAEYIRFGHDRETFDTNMNYLVENCSKDIIITMNWTITGLSIPYTAPLIEKVIAWNQRIAEIGGEPIRVNYNKCIDPPWYDPNIFPKGTFTTYIQEIHDLNDILFGQNHRYLEYVRGIFNEIEESDSNENLIKYLTNLLTTLDERRDTNWKETFPWLVDIRDSIE